MNTVKFREFDPGLALSVIKTLIYFKVRAIKPTLAKVQRLLINLRGVYSSSASLFEIKEILGWLQKKETVKKKEGTYQWMEKRQKVRVDSSVEQGKIAAEKMKIAVKAARILKLIPFIKLIGVCGTVATGNPRKASDIDLFIVAGKGRIWLARLGALFLLEITGRRKKKYKKAGRICLNHFVADDSLELRFKDLYTALELAAMICLLNKNNTFQKLKMKNLWVEKYLPNSEWKEMGISNYWGRKVQSNVETGFKIVETGLKPVSTINLLEGLARIFQERRIKQKRKREKGGQVYWGKDALIFHPEPKSVLFREQYRKKLAEQAGIIQGLLKHLGG